MKTLKYVIAIFAVALFGTNMHSNAQIYSAIDLKIPGTLGEILYQNNAMDEEQLTLRGFIDDRDLLYIRRMTYLRYLDISQTDLRSLPANAFCAMRNLATVRLPSNLRRIGRFAFDGCVLLFTFDITDRVTEIGEGAFSNCRALTMIEIPSSVTKLGKNAFMGCQSLGELVIEGETPISEHAFNGCVGLKTVICMSPTPPEVAADAFEGTPERKQLGVPAESVEIYRSHKIWGKLFSEILPATQK